jgi:membrane protein DedA with SNARE-associated domain
VLTAVTAALASNPAPELPGFLNVVGTYLGHYGYWAILLLVMLEDFGIPVPGETILIAAAIYAGAGRLNVAAVGLVGFIAAVIGDNIGFAIGHFGGRALALRWGKYIFLTEERLDKAEVFFARHGGKIIVVARFIEGLRQANGIIAGIAGMRWLRFLAFNALGAALWVGTWVSLGYLAGNHITAIYHGITQYSYYVLIAVVVLLMAYIVWRLRRRRKVVPDKTARPAAADSPQDADDTQDADNTQAADAPHAADAAQAADGTDTADALQAADDTHAADVTETTDAAGTIRAAGGEVHESS